MSEKLILKRSVVAITLALTSSHYAHAQTAAAKPDAPIERVEVTGSSLKRTSQETAGSIQVLTREDIERSGATTTLALITDAVDVGLNSAT